MSDLTAIGLKHTDETQSSANISTETCRKQITVSSILNSLTDAFAFSLQLCADTNLTNMQRQLALEVIVTLSETAAAMLRKHTAIVAQSGEDFSSTIDFYFS